VGEALVTSEHGIVVLLAGLIVTLCLHLFWRFRQDDGKKMEHLSKSLDDNSKAIHALSEQFKYFNQRIVDSDKEGIKTERSLEKLTAVVRALAGEKKWGEVQKKVKDMGG
jgi:hypothetical protein